MTEQTDGNNEEAEAPSGNAMAGLADMDEDRNPEEPMFSLDVSYVHQKCVDKQGH